ncbi:LysR substrate-binding domain-containing protein [Arenibaculum sp.]|uniref:LysR substrate-binding domain-containing protein n=1 Tax=Arenibaculum sp. TaxID=2865862 RepID=UPI002E111DA5|nr:LysR substrate-binding domain-containing protein [Arenibaculum sp.]
MRGPITRLASLDLARCFVAVGRRMSITLAARDLCLTQSAVSRQVHALEEALGVRLLNRGYRSISFTPEGERLFRVADAAVQQIQDAFAALANRPERLPVTVTASIGVTALWLLPRLGDFQRRHPTIGIRLAANNKLLDLQAEGADLAIRYCTARNAPPGSERLFGEAVVPVAHPSLGALDLGSPAAIEGQVLLEFDDPGRPWLQWADWLKAAGPVKPKAILSFNQYDQVIHAALAGQGIALGRLPLVEPMLADGRLVVLPGERQDEPDGYAYWLVRADPIPRPDVGAVIEWITGEARRAGTAP